MIMSLQAGTGRLLRIVRPVRRMPWAYDDGGRAAAGFPGQSGDCVCRAITIASARPYREVRSELNGMVLTFDDGSFAGASAGTGLPREIFRAYLKQAGWTWHPVMGIGTGCTMHLRAGEVPPGRIIARISRHLTAVIDGVIRDTFDPSRNGTRCVYGFWSQNEQEN
jgi:hypothetical protein